MSQTTEWRMGKKKTRDSEGQGRRVDTYRMRKEAIIKNKQKKEWRCLGMSKCSFLCSRHQRKNSSSSAFIEKTLKLSALSGMGEETAAQRDHR